MDCPQYLNQLDAMRPGSEDHEDPGVREALAHLSECDGCAREFKARGEFDRQVAARMRDVPVPAAARERLLEQLSRARATGATRVPAPTNRLAGRRSFVWKLLVPTAAVLLVGLIWYANRDPSQTRTMAHVQGTVAAEFANVTIEQYDGLDEFAGDFDPSIDDGRWERVTNRKPRGIDLDGDGQHDAAVYWMSGPVKGVLLVLSPDLVSDPPTNTSPVGPAPLYSPVRVAWMPLNSKKVHLCVLKGDADDGDLQRLLRYVIDSMTA